MDSFALRLPTGFPMDVLEIMSPKICNYLDIPLQHISDSILKSMRRGTKQKNNKIVKEFRAAVLVAIRTTLIVGYPEKLRKISTS
jgi:ribosomal protein S12 methylthiotransferase